MKSTFISKEKNDAKFSMEFTAEEFENAIIGAYKATKNKFVLDGFRKGKAPRKLIEAHYGEDVFFEDAINDLFSLNYSGALDQLDLNVVDTPRAEFSEIEKGKGFTITITVEVYPEFEVKDYKNIEINKIEHKVSDDDVMKELEKLQQRNVRMVLVERPAKEGDTVLIDYAGFVGDNQFEGGTAERYPLKLGSNSFIPGFEEQLLGVSTGESKDVNVTFPEEYHSEELAGKEAIFKCMVHEIKEEELPELNDDFAKDVSEYDTLEELKRETKDRLEKSAQQIAENQMKNAAIEQIYNANEIDVPGKLVEEEIDNMMNEFNQQLQYQGLNLEKYFEYLQKKPEDFRDEIREEAHKKVKTRMLIGKVSEQENLTATEEEVDKEIEVMAAHYKMEADKVKEMLGAETVAFIEKDIKIKKAVDMIYTNAIIK